MTKNGYILSIDQGTTSSRAALISEDCNIVSQKNIIRERAVSEDIVLLDVPDTAEDGNVVPVHFKINCSMKSNDYPKKVHVLGLENPFPEIAIYEFFPDVGKAEVSFRCRMRKSSYLMVIAEMSDGRIGLEKKSVDVMLGACS